MESVKKGPTDGPMQCNAMDHGAGVCVCPLEAKSDKLCNQVSPVQYGRSH